MSLPAAALAPATRAIGMGIFYTVYYAVDDAGPRHRWRLRQMVRQRRQRPSTSAPSPRCSACRCSLAFNRIATHPGAGAGSQPLIATPLTLVNPVGLRVEHGAEIRRLVATMSFAQKKSLPAAEERRRFQRVKVHLLGRYMLPDRREFPCQIINMSPGGLALLAPGIGNVGDRVIAYLDHIGRVEGRITRIIDNGFAMTVSATARKRDKLAAQLTWLANRDILNLPEDRRHDRIVPRNPIAVLTWRTASA